MRCPHCGDIDSKVLQTRDVEGAVRRRRECAACGRRFTTFERIEKRELFVVKNDHRREAFSREKILSGLTKACEKRPVSITTLETMADEIEEMLQERAENEIPSRDIGEWIMERLPAVDPVAYVRFASVYRQFQDVVQFDEILRQLKGGSEQEI